VEYLIAGGERQDDDAPAVGLADRRVEAVDEIDHPLDRRRLAAGGGAEFGPEQPEQDRDWGEEQIERELLGAPDQSKDRIKKVHLPSGPPTPVYRTRLPRRHRRGSRRRRSPAAMLAAPRLLAKA